MLLVELVLLSKSSVKKFSLRARLQQYKCVVDIVMYTALYFWHDEDILFYMEVPMIDLEKQMITLS